MDGLILAGGKSSRMNGTHKGSLMYHEQSFVSLLIGEMKKEVEEVWLSYGRVVHEEYEGCKIVQDVDMDCGPIGGLCAGIEVCSDNEVMVAACDMPFLKVEMFRYLYYNENNWEKDWDCIVPIVDGRKHPLAAIYRKSSLQILKEQIKEKNYRIMDMLEKMRVIYVDVSDDPQYRNMLSNINTPEEYKHRCLVAYS